MTCAFNFPESSNLSAATADSRVEHFSVAVDETTVLFTFTLSASQIHLIEKCRGFLQINALHQSIPHRFNIVLVPSHFDVTQTGVPRLVLFPTQCTEEPLMCRAHSNPVKECPQSFLSKRTTGPSTVDHDLGHLCRGRRIHMSGHSYLWSFSSVAVSWQEYVFVVLL